MQPETETLTKTEYQSHPNYEEILKEVGDIDLLNEEQLKKLAEVKVEIARRKRNNPLLFYKPYESRTKVGRNPQDEFHRSQAKIKAFIGGNRSGKSIAGCIEGIWLALGIHPYIKIRVPNSGWVISLDFPTSRDVMEQKWHEWLPKSEIKHWDKQDRIIRLRNDSVVGFKSCDQGVEKFGGVGKDWIGYDEEPPGGSGYAIWQESLMRTIDTAGRIFLTLTPTQGMSWTYDEIYEMAGVDKDIEVINAEIYENPYIKEEEIAKVEKLISEDEKDMRLKGKYISFSGLIYKNFKKEVNIIKGKDIREWYKYLAIDPGIGNPCAGLWVAMSRDSRIPEFHIYDEYYEADLTIDDNARNIVSINGGDKIVWAVLDPWAGSQRSGVSGTTTFETFNNALKKHSNGRIRLKRIDRYDKFSQISRIRQLLNIDEVTGIPCLTIAEHCYATIKEMARYRYQQTRSKVEKNLSETPLKILDHTMNCLESLISTNPRPEIFAMEEEMPEEVVWYK